jgi:hypothetical protein
MDWTVSHLRPLPTEVSVFESRTSSQVVQKHWAPLGISLFCKGAQLLSWDAKAGSIEAGRVPSESL